MFAVVRTGGKQYRVAEQDTISVEKMPVQPGETVSLDDVLMLDGQDGLTLGTPTVAGARVDAEVVEQTRGPRIIVFKKKRRKNQRRKKGHRQDLTVLRITRISAGGAGGPGGDEGGPGEPDAPGEEGVAA